MAADEPTGTPAPQEQKADAAPSKKRRRRRRPRRKPDASSGSGTSNAQPKKTGGTRTDAKATSGDRGASSSAAGSKQKGRQRSRAKQRRGAAKAVEGAKRHDAKRGDTNHGGAKRTETKRGGPTRGRAKRDGRQAKIPTTREVSAGGVVYRPSDEGIEVVLASRRTRRGQLAWGLAKGGIEQGETKEDAAIREVREETGMTAEIEADLGDTKYMYVWDEIRIRKTVHFFLMRHTGGNVDDRDDEMEEIRWFPLERAIKRAAYRGERDMLVKASELLR